MKLYKAFLAAVMMAASAVSFTSCDNDFDYPPVISPDLGGNGRWDAPLNVDGARAYYTAYYSDVPDVNRNYWVRGFIVGCVQTTETVFVANEQTVNMTGDFTANTNILLATDPAETNYENCIALQLPSGAVRNALNLKDNPTNLGREVCVYGYIDKYLGLAGMRSIAMYNWGSEGVDTGEVETGTSEFVKATELVSGRSYALVANNTAANTVSGGESGFLKVSEVKIADNKFSDTEKYGFLFTEVEGQPGKYYICDYRGMFLYNGLYNGNFSNRPSVSTSIAKDDTSYYWQPVQNADGKWIITNVGSSLTLLFDTSYSSYGLYSSITDQYLAPELYQMSNDPVVVPDFTPADPSNPNLPTEGSGEGTADSPFDAIRAYAAAAAGWTSEVYVEGVVVATPEIATDYGNATYYISPDGTTANQFYIYRGYYLGGAKFTATDQLKAGDKVVVKGNLTTYKEVPQLAQSNSLYKLNGQTSGSTTPDTPTTGSGTGTEADPYSVAAVQAGATGTGVWVAGYIVGSIPDKFFSEGVIGVGDNPSLTNMLISDTPNPADVNSCIPVALPAGDIRNALNLQANPGNLGKKVLIQGNLEKYFGVAGVKSLTSYVLDGASNPGTPDTPTTGGSGTGTADSPYDALGAIAAANSGVTGEVYVQGIISTIKEISTSYGNATYYISNDGTTTNEFYIYRGYYLDGAKFTSESQIKVGDKVVVKGELIVYGSTPELQAGNSIVSINGADTWEIKNFTVNATK